MIQNYHKPRWNRVGTSLSFPLQIMNKGDVNMDYVLVTVSGGIIWEVFFYTSLLRAIQALAEFVKGMNPEKSDAGVYSPEGMIANAKDFMDEYDRFINNTQKVIGTV